MRVLTSGGSAQQRPRRRLPRESYEPSRDAIWLYQPAGDTRSKATGETVPGTPIPWLTQGGIVKQTPVDRATEEGVVHDIKRRVFWCYAATWLSGLDSTWTLEFQGEQYILVSIERLGFVGQPKILHITAERVS